MKFLSLVNLLVVADNFVPFVGIIDPLPMGNGHQALPSVVVRLSVCHVHEVAISYHDLMTDVCRTKLLISFEVILAHNVTGNDDVDFDSLVKGVLGYL